MKIGDKIQIIFEDKKELLEVLEIKDNAFRVEPLNFNGSTGENCIVFVYGRQVDDFHTVDYQAISMLNVSATQQLAKEIKKLKKENEQLKFQVQKINQLEVIIQQLQAQLENQ